MKLIRNEMDIDWISLFVFFSKVMEWHSLLKYIFNYLLTTPRNQSAYLFIPEIFSGIIHLVNSMKTFHKYVCNNEKYLMDPIHRKLAYPVVSVDIHWHPVLIEFVREFNIRFHRALNHTFNFGHINIRPFDLFIPPDCLKQIVRRPIRFAYRSRQNS